MILDAVGADQIRSGLATATTTAQEHTTNVGTLAGILAEACDRYEQWGMAASTLALLRDAAVKATSAHTLLDAATWQLQEATSDFDARDGRVAEAVADAGNLMQAAGYAETFTLPSTGTTVTAPVANAGGEPDQPGTEPQMSPAEYLLALEDIRNGMAWMANNEGNPHWRPSPPSPELDAQLTTDSAADQAAEDQGLPAPDRVTCYTHQSWLADCVSDPSHSRPGLADGAVAPYNWCVDHRLPVQVCQCWPATVDGTPPAAGDPGPAGEAGDPAAAWAGSYRMSPKPVASGAMMGDDEFRQLLDDGLPEGQAMQARTDGEWADVPVRTPDGCDHRSGVCVDCTAGWSQRERLRVVQAPPPYEAPQQSGDDFYAFGGELDTGKPPYWTRRDGRTVVSQSLGGEVTRTEYPDLDTARAAFAEESCDPDGAGAPHPHDLITVHWGEHEGTRLRVVAVTRGPGRGDYTVQAQPADGGPPVQVGLHFGQYRIERRRPAPRTS
ncbi:hypothetical protein [Actinoplanes sp. G11-F43]|uniref:hypothetical protein n=1 Tax=Actinoplanes sp. G11-F43 TaxID=3424130 RepID=UPI003D3429BD